MNGPMAYVCPRVQEMTASTWLSDTPIIHILLSRISELIEIHKLQKDDPPGLLKLTDPIKYSNACPGYNQLRFKKELKISIQYQSEHKLKKQQQRSQSSGVVKHSNSFTLPNQCKVPGAAYS